MNGQRQLPLPAATGGLIPVAAYVRMSTEHQQYSTENQLDRIKEYAARRGMVIVRVFADEGKSGLSVKGRESLRRMIAEVEAGKADFKGILAYDVSRWGRFQDADESGYYEYIASSPRLRSTRVTRMPYIAVAQAPLCGPMSLQRSSRYWPPRSMALRLCGWMWVWSVAKRPASASGCTAIWRICRV